MTDINQIIFSRTQPLKKVDVINHLTEAELLATTKVTIFKIVKEVGSRLYKIRNKRLYIDDERRTGNDWNSIIEGLDLVKNRLYVNIYVQYENTDTNTFEDYDKFFMRNHYRGEIRRLDRHGNGRTYYYSYNESDKAKVMRSFLLEYVYKKYNDKLNNDLN